MASGNRPLSPHLQVYRFQITMLLSITHRILGAGLTIGALLFTYWISSATYGPEAYATAQSFLGSWFGRLVLFGFTFSVFYHMCNGIRHMLWDTGWGFDMPTLRKTGWTVVVVSVTLTLVTFAAGYGLLGGG